MKSIKTFKLVIFISFGLLLLQLIVGIILVSSEVFFDTSLLGIQSFNPEKLPIFLKVMVFFKVVSVLLFTIGVYYLVTVLKANSIKEYFSNITSSNFKKAGIYIILSGSLAFSLTLASYFISEVRYVFYMNLNNLPFLTSLIIGLFLLLFSKVLYKALVFKKENDLTI